MSDFRDQFDQARADYQSARYPGDLAADLRDRSRSRSFWRIGIAFAAAASIAIVVGVTLFHGSTNPTGTGTTGIETSVARVSRSKESPATTDPTDAVADATADDTLSAPLPASEAMPDSQSTFPTELPTMPAGDSASAIPSFPSAPSMPSFDSSTHTTSDDGSV